MTGGRGGWSSYSGFLRGVKINNIVNCANMTNSGGSRGGPWGAQSLDPPRTNQAVDQIRVVDCSSHQISLSSLHIQNINLIINFSIHTFLSHTVRC